MNIKNYIPIIIILILLLLGYFSGVYEVISFNTLKEKHLMLKAFVQAHPVLSPLLFLGIYIISTTLSFPAGAVLSVMGGYLFGVPFATLYVLFGATIGASLIFLAARCACVDLLRKKAAPFLRKLEEGFKKNAWSYLLFLRFIPLFPFWLVNLAPAFFNVRLWTFIWTTFLGIIPGSYAFTQAGSGLAVIFDQGKEFSLEAVLNMEFKIALVAIALFSLLPILIKKILANRKKNIDSQ